MYSNGRIHDFALLLAHAWRCAPCRAALLDQPEHCSVGYKLDQAQRDCIKGLSDETFQTLMRLAAASGIALHDLNQAIDHPRARLRHLDGQRYDFRTYRT